MSGPMSKKSMQKNSTHYDDHIAGTIKMRQIATKKTNCWGISESSTLFVVIGVTVVAVVVLVIIAINAHIFQLNFFFIVIVVFVVKNNGILYV